MTRLIGGHEVGAGCCILGAVGTAVALTAGIYWGLGTLGWRMIRSTVHYPEKYNEALVLADSNRDGNVDTEEGQTWFREMKVIRLPNQRIADVRPSYSSLCDYVGRHGN